METKRVTLTLDEMTVDILKEISKDELGRINISAVIPLIVRYWIRTKRDKVA